MGRRTLEKYTEKRLQDKNAPGQTSRVQPAFYEEGIKIGAAKKGPMPRRHANGPTSQDGGTESGQKCHPRRGKHAVSLFAVDDGMDPGDSRGTMQR